MSFRSHPINREILALGLIGCRRGNCNQDHPCVECESKAREVFVAAAEGHNQTELQDLLNDGIYINWINLLNFEQTALMTAVDHNNPVNVAILIKAGADLNRTDIIGRTAVWIAADHGYNEILGKLIEAGADLTIPANDGQTPLQRSHAKGNGQCRKLILEKLILESKEKKLI